MSGLSRDKKSGFTLLEIMMVIAIIGILAAIALPSYKRYINEAKAANFLIDIHDIALAYHDVLATHSISTDNKDQLSSPAFGQAPPYLPGLNNIYSAKHGISLSSQLVNHSGYFQYTGHEAFPVLFLKASTQQGTEVLSALDHLTKFKHTFVTPSVMMIALATPHESHRPTESSTDNLGTAPAETEVTPPNASESTRPPPDTTHTASETDTQQPTGTTTEVSETGQSTPNPPNPPVETVSTATAGSNAGSGLNWPPGWAMHPDKHTGQQHPGNSGH